MQDELTFIEIYRSRRNAPIFLAKTALLKREPWGRQWPWRPAGRPCPGNATEEAKTSWSRSLKMWKTWNARMSLNQVLIKIQNCSWKTQYYWKRELGKFSWYTFLSTFWTKISSLDLEICSKDVSTPNLSKIGQKMSCAGRTIAQYTHVYTEVTVSRKCHVIYQMCIRALSAHSAAEFNISPGRWQHLWLVAIVPPKRWGKMDRNDCHTAWGNFKTLISLL
jgi:hypothetical protein